MDFSEINDTRIPFVYLEFDPSKAAASLSGSQPYKALLIADGAPSGELFQIRSEKEAADKFGVDSKIAKMAKGYLANSDIEVYAIATGEGEDLSQKIKSAFALIQDEQFNVIAFGYAEYKAILALKEELQSRSSAKRQIEGLGFVSINSKIDAVPEEVKKLNCPYIVALPCVSDTDSHIIAAALAGVVSKHAQLDPARPFQTLELKEVSAPSTSNREGRAAQEEALKHGLSTFYVDYSGQVRIQRLVTTYTKNASGMDDISYLSPCTITTLSFLRWDFKRYFTNKYPRHKLASDQFKGTGPVLTPKLIKAETVCLFRQWEEKGLVHDMDAFQQGLYVEIDSKDPARVNIAMSPKLVAQLSVIGAKLSFLLK
jgi:phage tail sheath gpL-like